MSKCSEHLPKPGILIVADNHRLSEELEGALRDSDLTAERVASMEAACIFASTGQFQLVVTSQALFDGTWRRLTSMATRLRPGFVVIVVTTTEFDQDYYATALEEGVFEVLDASHELARLGGVARCAMWAAYLEGGGPRPEKGQMSS
jgi:DNA-binding NtrC family response regulator